MEEGVGRVSSNGCGEQNLNYNEQDGSGSLMGADKVECSIEEGRIEGDALRGTSHDLGLKSEGAYCKENELKGPSGEEDTRKSPIKNNLSGLATNENIGASKWLGQHHPCTYMSPTYAID
ncbi:hypothetical protein SLEP1_g58149 [Rubroshorea leprosula]|uniref:Uncharacterized protein n=1 Tax=Rubroshorea leprosula TaxID=152421 RepID=A0AAV5MR80_9ROSI|nr:hypothetical protein SLEP1_g58149 [Rubroshorea leprosula]